MGVLVQVLTEEDFISASEYDQLDEGAKRAYRRVGNNITQYYRCTSGPKKGKLASDPSKCGQRKDPKRVRHGRKVAQQKGSIRIRKTIARKRTQLSRRVTALNNTLKSRTDGSSTKGTKKPVKTKESFIDFVGQEHLIENLNDHQFNLLIENLDYCIDFVEGIGDYLLENEITDPIESLNITYNINESNQQIELLLHKSDTLIGEIVLTNVDKGVAG